MIKKHRIIAYLFVFAVLLLPFGAAASAEESASADVWDGSVGQGFESGDGTGKAPYIIKTAEQLAFFANSVNGGESYRDKRVELHADIDLNKLEWIPIGTEENPFAGTFMGRSHVVRGLRISDKDGKIKGLFGCIESAYIFNLILADSDIECNETAGGIVAKSVYGSVENCRSYATVSANSIAGGIVGYNFGGDVEKCINFGFVYSSNGGGIVGMNAQADGAHSLINSCRNVGRVVGGNNVGGIVGGDYGGAAVQNCINTADIAAKSYAGGIVGFGGKTEISSCRNNGDVYAEDEKSYVGGIAGSNGGNIENSYSSGNIDGNIYVGGIAGAGAASEAGIKYCYSVGVATGSDFVGAIIGDKGNSLVETCYYMVCGASDKQGKTCFGIGNTQNDGVNTKCLDYETMKWGEAYQGFDFSVWTTGGSIDYNYPELVSHGILDEAYVSEYGNGDPLRGFTEQPSDSEDGEADRSVGEARIPRWVWLIGGFVIVALFAFLAIKARKK